MAEWVCYAADKPDGCEQNNRTLEKQDENNQILTVSLFMMTITTIIMMMINEQVVCFPWTFQSQAPVPEKPIKLSPD